MHVICAWCKAKLRSICDFCGSELEKIPQGEPFAGLLICNQPPTAVMFNPDTMRTSHGICDTCAIRMTSNREWADIQTPEDIANQQAATHGEARTVIVLMDQRPKEPPK